MKLKFNINQAESFRLGIDAPKSHAMIEVDPTTLHEDHRKLIAERMHGILVCFGRWEGDKIVPKMKSKVEGDRIVCVLATFEDLMKYIRVDQERLDQEKAGQSQDEARQ